MAMAWLRPNEGLPSTDDETDSLFDSSDDDETDITSDADTDSPSETDDDTDDDASLFDDEVQHPPEYYLTEAVDPNKGTTSMPASITSRSMSESNILKVELLIK
jgi:hypothetical protein